jgi:bifunctional oligoribonuclease and PAP phosphatase NrnA
LNEVVELVRRGKRFMVAAHARPDGDALGSMLATAHGLRALGKEVVIFCQDRAPARLGFLPGASELVTKSPPGPFDGVLVHDCGDARLLGPNFPSKEVTGPVIVLDHHASVRDFGDLVVRDPSASAVGVIVGRLLAALGVSLTREIAECLWCSLVSDTGWFRYPATDVETLELATACVRAGASPWQFALRAEEEAPVARIKLLGLVLSTLSLHGEPPRRVAILRLDENMLSAAGAKPEYADQFVNYARALEGVEIGVLLTHARQNVRVSLRSKGGFDVGALASKFDGGGHRGAAGCILPLPLENAQKTLLDAIAAA